MEKIKIQDSTIMVEAELNFANALQLWEFGNKIFNKQHNLTNNHTLSSCDLRNVSKVDSSGLAVMLEWQRLSTGKLRFINIPLDLQLIAQISGVSSLLNQQ